jgi:hypothetical protein
MNFTYEQAICRPYLYLIDISGFLSINQKGRYKGCKKFRQTANILQVAQFFALHMVLKK